MKIVKKLASTQLTSNDVIAGKGRILNVHLFIERLYLYKEKFDVTFFFFSFDVIYFDFVWWFLLVVFVYKYKTK